MRRLVPALMLLVLLLLIAYGLSASGRTAAEAASLLVDVWSVGRVMSAGLPERRLTMEYSTATGERRSADIYCEDEPPPQARLLVIHGLVGSGKDDSRLRSLGAAFARHRFLVMVPDFPGMRALRVSPNDIDEVEEALAALSPLDRCPPQPPIGRGPFGGGPIDAAAAGAGPLAPAPVRPLQTGVLGFSYSVGPALLALDRRPGSADFAVLFGGYYDLEDLILFQTTGRYRDRGADLGGEALPEARWILLGANADLLADPRDRAALLSISRRRRADPTAEIGDLTAGLGPEARATLDLLSNTDPGRFEPLLARAGPALRRTIDALSPSKSLSRPLGVDLYLLHGRSDAIVPYTETLKLGREVRTSGRIEMVLLGGFRHARPDGTSGDPGWKAVLLHPRDSLRLFRILTEIVERRGRKAG